MTFLETGLIALLALWALGSVLFLFRLPLLHPWLTRWNGSKMFVHWSLFSASDPTKRPGTMELLFRDGDRQGNFGRWQVAATGHCWSWRAALWLPERALASALQNVGREIHWCMHQEPPALLAAGRHAQFLAEYLARIRPLAPGAVREHQLVRRFASDGTTDWEFPFPSSAHDAAS